MSVKSFVVCSRFDPCINCSCHTLSRKPHLRSTCNSGHRTAWVGEKGRGAGVWKGFIRVHSRKPQQQVKARPEEKPVPNFKFSSISRFSIFNMDMNKKH